MDTPPPLSSAQSSGSLSPASELARSLPPAFVQAYALHVVSPLLQCSDSRWTWGLAGALIIAVPTAAKIVLEVVRVVVQKRT